MMNSEKRMEWDEYFISIALLASLAQSFMLGQSLFGIIVWFQWDIAGCPHVSHIRDGHEQATIHSEINAICDCAKRGVTLNGAKIYITHYPCLKTISSSGIVEIIYLEDYNNDELVASIAKDANIVIRKLDKK